MVARKFKTVAVERLLRKGQKVKGLNVCKTLDITTYIIYVLSFSLFVTGDQLKSVRQKSNLVLSQIISYTKGYQTYFQIISLQRATLLPQYAFLSLLLPRETCSKNSALLGQLLSVTTFGCKIDDSVKVPIL